MTAITWVSNPPFSTLLLQNCSNFAEYQLRFSSLLVTPHVLLAQGRLEAGACAYHCATVIHLPVFISFVPRRFGEKHPARGHLAALQPGEKRRRTGAAGPLRLDQAHALDAIRRARMTVNGTSPPPLIPDNMDGTTSSGGNGHNRVSDDGQFTGGNNAVDRAQLRAERGVGRKAVAASARRMVDRGAKESRIGRDEMLQREAVKAQQRQQQMEERGIEGGEVVELDNSQDRDSMEEDSRDTESQELSSQEEGDAPIGEPGSDDDVTILSGEENMPTRGRKSRQNVKRSVGQPRRRQREAGYRRDEGTTTLVRSAGTYPVY